MASMLCGIKTPKVGGDTGFASTYRAYDALPPKTAGRLDTKPARISLVEMQLVNNSMLPPLTEAENAIARMSGILSTAYIPKPAKIFLCWPLGGRLEGILCNEGRDLIDDLTAHISKP